MSQAEIGHAAEDAAAQAGLRRTFLLILVVEVLTIAALYAFSLHFAQP